MNKNRGRSANNRSLLRRHRQTMDNAITNPSVAGAVPVVSPSVSRGAGVVVSAASAATSTAGDDDGGGIFECHSSDAVPIVMAEIVSSGNNESGEGEEIYGRNTNQSAFDHDRLAEIDHTRTVGAGKKNELNVSPETEIEKIEANIFSEGSGISSNEIRKVLRVRVSSKKMNATQELEAGKKVIKRLKNVLTVMAREKNRLVHLSKNIEKSLRSELSRAVETKCRLNDKVAQLKADNAAWRDKAEVASRELFLSNDRVQNLRNEIGELKGVLGRAEDAEKQALVALEIEKVRNREKEEHAQRWQNNITMTQETFVRMKLAEKEDEIKALKKQLLEASNANTQALIALELERARIRD